MIEVQNQASNGRILRTKIERSEIRGDEIIDTKMFVNSSRNMCVQFKVILFSKVFLLRESMGHLTVQEWT